jgi:predicted Zn-dependent protease with MMP-like domain
MASPHRPVDPEALAAELDRGWDLVERADFDGAERCANEILSLDPDCPEGVTLLGAVRQSHGDAAGALECYRRATELDPEFADPLLYAAEVLLETEGDADEAIRLCEEALERSSDEELLIDALLLKADAEICDELDDAAAETLEQLPDGPLGEPSYDLRAGELWLDLGDLERAQTYLERAVDDPACAAEAWHAIGRLEEAREDSAAMTRAWVKVRELDLGAPRVPWSMTEAEFEALAEHALGELPPRARGLLANVPVLVADYPTREFVDDGNDPRVLGFFSGVPYPEKSAMDGVTPHLDAIFLYQRNLEQASRSREELEVEIRHTLLHEAGHFFGMTEEDLEAIGLG